MNFTKNAAAIAVFIAAMEEPCHAMPFHGKQGGQRKKLGNGGLQFIGNPAPKQEVPKYESTQYKIPKLKKNNTGDL